MQAELTVEYELNSIDDDSNLTGFHTGEIWISTACELGDYYRGISFNCTMYAIEYGSNTFTASTNHISGNLLRQNL